MYYLYNMSHLKRNFLLSYNIFVHPYCLWFYVYFISANHIKWPLYLIMCRCHLKWQKSNPLQELTSLHNGWQIDQNLKICKNINATWIVNVTWRLWLVMQANKGKKVGQLADVFTNKKKSCGLHPAFVMVEEPGRSGSISRKMGDNRRADCF